MYAMHVRLLHTVVLLLLCTLALQAQPAQQDDDFVRASLVTLGPGDEVYSCYGHTAIRLECPTHRLDYCFTFEMALTAEEKLKFMFSTAKAGFIAAATETFFSKYKAEGRSISQRQLNLRPAEEQELWRMLDQEMGQGAHWDYNFLTTNCSSMVVWIIERALARAGERIDYGPLPACVSGTYGDLLDHISARAPWARLFWTLRMGTKGSERGQLSDKLAPAVLEAVWADAAITDSAGHRRPVFAAEPQLLAPQLAEPSPTVVTPTVAFILTIIFIITIIIIKKQKLMKKAFTSFRGKRLLLTVAIVLTSALQTLAGGEDWYAFNIKIDTYPTGAGLVYVDENDLSAFVEPEGAEYKESLNLEVTTTSTSLNAFAKANEGWNFLGFSKDIYDAETDQWTTVLDEVSSSENPAFLTLDNGVNTKHYDEASGTEVSDDSVTVAAQMPLDPNNIFHALFTRVCASVAEGQTAMGTVSIDKLVNNIGDKVTLTATPDNEFCSFTGWTLNGEAVSAEATITVDVTAAANYVANFSDTRTVTLHFPEEGGYQLWYNDYDYFLNYAAEAYSPYVYYTWDNDALVDSLTTEGQRVSHLSLVGSGYQAAGKRAALLYGFGDVTISPASGFEADENEGDFSASLFRWSGTDGVADVAALEQGIDSLDLKFIYYTFDLDKMKFNRVTTGAIAPNSLYMRLFNTMVGDGLEAPEVIYFDADTYEQAATDVNSVKAAAVGPKAVYDLQGRRVGAVGRQGIYVTDGKKVVYRQK